MKLEKQETLDDIDLQILRQLKADGRFAMSELAQLVKMSAPSVTDRVRRLENRGIIKKFTVDLDQAALGYDLEAVIRLKPRPGNLHVVEQMILDEPRFTACDKVTGDDCFFARLALRSIAELAGILDPFHERAETNTSIITSSPIKSRTPLIG